VTYVALLASALCHDGSDRRSTEFLNMKRFLAFALLLPSVSMAQDDNVSYQYFDINYFRTDWDFGSTETEGSGYAGRFSVAIRNHVYVAGEYRAWEFEGTDVIDGYDHGSTYKRFGFGVHGSIGENWGLYGEAGFKSYDLDFGTGNFEDDPGYIGGGVRWYAADGYEIRIGADFAEAGKDTLPGRGETTLTFGGDIYVTDAAAITVEVTEDDENTTTFMMGLRFYPKKDTSDLRQYR
jgi:hypothetical protein